VRGSTKIRSIAAATALLTLTALSTGFGPASFAAARSPGAGSAARPALGAARVNLDVRKGTTGSARAAAERRLATASARPATRRLAASLGAQGVVQLDATTGTVRIAGRLNGYLTGPSSAAPAAVAMRYVRAHLAALGLRRSDLPTFRMTRDYRDIAGTHHLSWTQSVGGVPVFSNGLQAAVGKTGRLLMVGGSPVSGLRLPKAASKAVTSARAAIAAARASLGESAAAGRGDVAHRVLFVTAQQTRLAWLTVTMSASQPATSVVDASNGRILYRRSLASDASTATDLPATRTPATGIAYRYFPGHKPRGGTADPVNFTKLGWLASQAKVLSGNNSHAYSDVNDDNVANPSEEVHPSAPHQWDYKLQPFHLKNVSFCGNPYPCTWNPGKPFSWRVNRKQNTTQVFFFVNNWHDHLKASPIGFTEAAGNFQAVNFTGRGKQGDPVDTQTDDGANTDHGLPDGAHIDNANMDTPPDGQSPRMQMYLQHQPGASYPDGDPFAPTDVGDEADTVYHEYTHGLSNRLVIDATGNSTLGDVEAGAMGEAWSDWYAMDYLVAHGLQKDIKGKTNIVIFQFDGAGTALDRTEPIDCKVGVDVKLCGGGSTGHGGGYTYRDYSKVIGIPEVHADGEIWSQTLWDLRDKVGSKVAESLVTRALELSPPNPSYLDERNAILMADTVVYGHKYENTIWRVFAHRGMGYFAGALSGDDSSPGADFHLPPATSAAGVITGKITDTATGAPVSGATVTLAFAGGRGFENPSATTGADGKYRIGPVPAGQYPKFAVSAPGYDPATQAIRVRPSGTRRNVALIRDWAATSGGASVTGFNGPDLSPECGPDGAFDQSLATGWGSTTGDDAGDPTNHFIPKHVVVKLPKTVDVSSFGVDPTATCGDGASASTAGFQIETSPDGTTWTTAATGTFTSADNGKVSKVTPTAGAAGVRFVRFTITSNQTPDFATNCPAGAFAGCSFTDLTEVEVFGS
jgi:extracellular elastinolytic metalloproteinase